MAVPITPRKEAKSEITTGELHEYIKETVNKLGPDVSKEEKKEHAKLMVKIFEKGMSPKEAMQITDEEVAQIYSFAYSKFSAGQYADSRELFKMLLTLEPLNPDFATALGICHHRLKNYDYAINCYMLGGILDMKSPVCFFYLYDCYVNTNDMVAAGVMLCNVIARCGDQPIYASVKKDAQARLDVLQKKIVEEQTAENKTS